MFGYDDATLERERRRRPTPWWRLLMEITGLIALLVVCGGMWLITDEQAMHRLVAWASRDANVDVYVGDLEVDPSSRWYKPTSWRFHILDVSVTNHDPTKADLKISRVSLPLPSFRMLLSRRIHFRDLMVVGLYIRAKKQRPPPPWKAREAEIDFISADTVTIWNANFSAAEDPPLKLAAAERIYGTLYDARFDPGVREFDAHGSLNLYRFQTGQLDVNHIHLDSVLSVDSNLTFSGTLRFAGARGNIQGKIDHFHRGPANEIKVRIAGVPIEGAVYRATRQQSPLTGYLAATLTIRSGGDIPRGRGVMEGDARITNAVVPLGEGMNPWLKDLIRLAPYLVLNDDDEVELNIMEGRIRFSRGEVDLEELVYHAPRRDIQLRGFVNSTGRELVFRLVPARNADVKPGLGIVLHSEPNQKLKLRLAKRWDLLPDVYEEDPDDPDMVDETGKRKRPFRLFRKNKQKEKPVAVREE